MNFKKFEVYGFKSFADKLSIEFNDGVTAIVGPNGCGKSNVVDAIRFVLGEQAPKNLRAGKMTDVIFGGTEKRKSLSFCQVSIYIDNTARIFPKSPFDEVIISRKLYKSGQSEYLLNNETVRLSDILDLIRDTGAGKDGYSIVGQGKIDEIMNAKPENRRSIFEDAAGILTFKKRRNDTRKKLDSANDSIRVLEYRKDSLEKDLGPLEKQSEKAKKFFEIKDRLRVLESNDYLYRYDNGDDQKRKIRDAIQGYEEESADLERQIEDIDSQYTAKMMDRHNADVMIGRLRDEQTELAVRQEAMRGKGNTLSERISNLNEQKQTEQQRSVRLEEQIEAKGEQLSDLLNHLAMANEDKAELQSEIAAKEERYLALVDEISARESEIDRANRTMVEAMASIADIKEDKGKLLAERDAVNERIAEVNGEIDLIKRTIESEEKTKRNYETSVENKLKQKEKLARNKNEVASEVDSVAANADNKRRLISQYDREIATLETRALTLGEYKGNIPGLVLKEVARKNPEIGKRMLGLVADLIEVPEQYVEAIGVALGAGMHNIVTATPEDTKVLIEYLRVNRIGRGTFLPLTTYKANDLSSYQEVVLRERGCIGVASKLIKYDAKYASTISGLLGKTVIVDTYDNALAISRKYPNLVRMVTLSGDMFSTTGSISGGSRSKQSNYLMQDQELAQAKAKAKKAKEEREKLVKALSEDTTYLRELQAQLSEYEDEVKAAEVAYATENERLSRVCAKIDELIADMSNKQNIIEILSNKLKAIELNLQEIGKSESDVSGARSSADDAASKHKEQFEEKKRQRDKFSEELSSMRAELASVNTSVDKVTDDIERVKGEYSDLQQQLKSCKEAVETLVTRIAQTESGLNNAVVSDKDKEEYEQLKTKIADAEKYRASMDEILAGLNARKDEMQKRLSSVAASKAKQEAALERLDDTLNALGERLREEHNILSYDEANAYRVADFDQAAASTEIAKLKRERTLLGDINPNAIEEYRVKGAEYEDLRKEYDDLVAAREDFEKIIADLSKQMLEKFNVEFAKIQDNFREIFRELFGGGNGKLELEPPEDGDMLEAGVEIYAQPPGKTLKSMSLLSGGEKAMTAIAILFAILKLRPMPFVILDETEAALDDSNVEVFARYLKKFSDTTQFIVVTHRKPTMELADRLYGVTMQEKGVSTIVTVSLSEAVKHSSSQ